VRLGGRNSSQSCLTIAVLLYLVKRVSNTCSNETDICLFCVGSRAMQGRKNCGRANVANITARRFHRQSTRQTWTSQGVLGHSTYLYFLMVYLVPSLLILARSRPRTYIGINKAMHLTSDGGLYRLGLLRPCSTCPGNACSSAKSHLPGFCSTKWLSCMRLGYRVLHALR